MSDEPSNEAWPSRLLWIVVGVVVTGVLGVGIEKITNSMGEPDFKSVIDPGSYYDDGTLGPTKSMQKGDYHWHTRVEVENITNNKADSVTIRISFGMDELQPTFDPKHAIHDAEVSSDDLCTKKLFEHRNYYFVANMECPNMRGNESRFFKISFSSPPDYLAVYIGYSNHAQTTKYHVETGFMRDTLQDYMTLTPVSDTR